MLAAMSTKENTSRYRYSSTHASSSVLNHTRTTGASNDSSQQGVARTARSSSSTGQVAAVNSKSSSTGSNAHLNRDSNVTRENKSGTSQNTSELGQWNNWKLCRLCSISFRNAGSYVEHLRNCHCTKEGRGLFVCRYGNKGICTSSPIQGISDKDYDIHVARDHAVVKMEGNTANKSTQPRTSAEATDSSPATEPAEEKWTVYSSSVNLPAVLNDPRKMRRETDFFTKTWGETFVEKADIAPSPYLPNITRSYFQRYLRHTASKLRSRRRTACDTDGATSTDRRQRDHNGSELDQVPKNFFRSDFALENPDTFEAVLPWSQSKGHSHSDFKGSQQSSKLLQEKNFFRSDFALENPDTFEAVLPWSQSKGHSHSDFKGSQQSSKLLQEKLSHYLDIVEVQIAKQISMRSNAFFSAMASHDALQEHLASTCTAIKQLRDKVTRIDDVLARGSLEILKHKIARVNHIKVYNKLKLMATVHQTQPTIQLLLSTSEFVGALDLISTTQEVLTQELAGIQSFRHLGSQLVELEKLIDKMLQDEFAKFIGGDLHRPLDDRLPPEEERMTAILLGMLRQRKFDFIEKYREEAANAVKAIVKQTVVEAVTFADADTNGSLAEQMRNLSFSLWLDLFIQVFENLSILIHTRVKPAHDIMQSLVDLAGGIDSSKLKEEAVTPVVNSLTNGEVENGTMHTDLFAEADGEVLVNGDVNVEQAEAAAEEEDNFVPNILPCDVDLLIAPNEHHRLHSGLKEMLVFVCDYAHDRCLKLLIARGKDGFLERLSSSEFVSLSRAIGVFIGECEKACGRRSTSLRGGLQNQANKFVSRFHEERKNKLSLILDSERWKQSEVPAELQDLLREMAQGVISLALLAKTDMGDAERKPLDCLQINGQRYTVVGTVLLLLKMVAEYCQCVEDIPTVSMDISTRLIEILQLFNSRSCQLILGAGALQLVGLKTITTKNLALTSRCLQLVALYIPIVKEFFAQRLPPKQQVLLKNFDKILKDYNDHVQEISNKLVAIMDDSFRQCLSTWEVKAPVPSPCFREICKRIRKIYEAIADTLPPEQIKVLFLKLNVSFKAHVKEQLVKLNVRKDGGPKHGLVTSDVMFYTECLQSLNGLRGLVNNMDDIWDR